MAVSFARRLGVLAATTALAAGALGVVTTAPAQAAPEKDNARVKAGARWLAGQLASGPFIAYGAPDWGITIDAATSLLTVGRQDAAVAKVRDGLASGLDSYITGEAWGDAGSLYAGPAAKALTFVQAVGADPRSFGGRDLVATVAGTVGASGRIQDTSMYGDNANVLGQTFAVRALAAVAPNSTEAAKATDFLLTQQCSAGWFRTYFTSTASYPDPTVNDDTACDADAESAPDTDATALAVLALQSQKADPDVAAALTKALDWLTRAQGANGAFGGGTSTEAPNGNSTGLAGWALGVAEREAAAEKAAGWLLAHQAVSLDCLTSPLEGDEGAIGYDDAAYTTGGTEGITDLTRDQWRRTTAQALPALDYLDLSRATLEAPARYFEDGSTAPLKVGGLLAGEQACVAGQLVTGPAASTITAKLPATTGTTTFTLDRLGAKRTVDVTTLAAQTFKVGVKKKLKRGKKALVTVAGLAPAEKVTVTLRKKVLAEGKAGPTGLFLQRVKVKGKPGKASLTVTGEFADRTGAKRVTVRR